MTIQFKYSILYVADVLKTLKFYEETFGFKQKLLTPENDYGELDTGSTTLAFASLELGKSNFKKGFQESSIEKQPFGFELAFTSDNVPHTFENALKHGAEILSKPVQKPWGQEVGYLRDINGFILEICSPL